MLDKLQGEYFGMKYLSLFEIISEQPLLLLHHFTDSTFQTLNQFSL